MEIALAYADGSIWEKLMLEKTLKNELNTRSTDSKSKVAIVSNQFLKSKSLGNDALIEFF